jgi:hypothetical protein
MDGLTEMTPWFPKTDLMFHEVKATRVGRFKMWVHFRVLRNYAYPYIPWQVRVPFYKAVRRWVFGPNANHEDLHALLNEITEAAAKAS